MKHLKSFLLIALAIFECSLANGQTPTFNIFSPGPTGPVVSNQTYVLQQWTIPNNTLLGNSSGGAGVPSAQSSLPIGIVTTGSVATTTITAPNAPSNVEAFAGPAQITVTWQAPLIGTPTGYTVTVTPGTHVSTVTGLTATITGLTNGTAYTASVTANNSGGSSTALAATAVTPTASGTSTGQVPTALTTGITSGLLFAWYSADQIAGPPNNGAPIGATTPWLDYSGNGWNPGSQPNTGTFVSSWTNSKPAVLWTGANGGTGTYVLLPFSLTQVGGEFTIFAVCDLTAATNQAGENDMRLLSNNSSAATSNSWEVDGYGNGSTTNTFRNLWSLSSYQSSTLSLTTPYVYSGVYGIAVDNTSGNHGYINGTKQTGTLSAQTQLVQDLVWGATRLGNYDKAWKGRFAELIVIAGSLTDTDRHTVEAYLGTKYNITMAVQ